MKSLHKKIVVVLAGAMLLGGSLQSRVFVAHAKENEQIKVQEDKYVPDGPVPNRWVKLWDPGLDGMQRIIYEVLRRDKDYSNIVILACSSNENIVNRIIKNSGVSYYDCLYRKNFYELKNGKDIKGRPFDIPLSRFKNGYYKIEIDNPKMYFFIYAK